MLKDRGEKLRYLASNNLVYFSTVLNDGARASFLLQEARLLREAGERHRAPHLLLTFCRAVLQFSTDLMEIESVRRIATAITRDGSAPEEMRREAAFYLTRIDETIQRVKKAGGRE